MRLHHVLTFVLLRGARGWGPPPAVLPRGAPRWCSPDNADVSRRPPAVTAVLIDRLGCSEADADRAVSRMLKDGAYLETKKALAVCDALQSRLSLS
eukprot:CAMPEP_0194343076 /NCGR_PEP_ID=MMETSP0171-20130528/95091_1 /TAXON_ID=218684 /ORGANISM="Corethron pennatum, Strain L29A3" /LENGTH=95 /DNA_ID=CAMNT_0039109077 /DNA_START=44 /DNA_END=328 /DNA_ORIENTATION=+